jgi:hypothetical protein
MQTLTGSKPGDLCLRIFDYSIYVAEVSCEEDLDKEYVMPVQN